MKKFSGFLLSEYVTAIIIIIVSIAVVFGLYVGHQRDTMVERAKDTLAAIETQLAAAAETHTLQSCDNSMVGADVLANDYLTFSIKSLPINAANPKEGYAAAVFVECDRKADGNDALDTAKRLYKSLDEGDKYTVTRTKKDKDAIAFHVMFSDYPVCEG